MQRLLLALVAVGTTVSGLNLDNVCTDSNVQSALSSIDILGLTLNINSVATAPVSNHTVSESDNYPAGSGLDFCNVTFSYSHNGLDDKVCYEVDLVLLTPWE